MSVNLHLFLALPLDIFIFILDLARQNVPQYVGYLWARFEYFQVRFAYVPIPSRAKRATSIPLKIFFFAPHAPPAPPPKTQNTVKKRNKKPKIEINRGPIRTCVDSN